MKTLLILLFAVAQVHAFDLKTPVDPATLVGKLGVSYQSRDTVIQSWKPEFLSKKSFHILEGPAQVQVFDASQELYAVSQSRIVYIRSTLEEVYKAGDPLAAPYPPPVFDPQNIQNHVVSDLHHFSLFDFLYKQKVKIFTIKANCRAATHYLKSSNSTDLRVQTLVQECVDADDSAKLISKDAIQSTDIISIEPQVTAILLRNFALAKRNKFGFIKPSPDDLKNAAMDMCDTSLRAVLTKLGVTSDLELLFQTAM